MTATKTRTTAAAVPSRTRPVEPPVPLERLRGAIDETCNIHRVPFARVAQLLGLPDTVDLQNVIVTTRRRDVLELVLEAVNAVRKAREAARQKEIELLDEFCKGFAEKIEDMKRQQD